MTKNVFIFWIGDEKKLSSLKLERFKDLSFVVGPSAQEHNYLMSISKYYRESYNLKKYSFCSDVWRVYVLSKFSGVYIDASVTLGNDFEKFVDEMLLTETTLIRERGNVIASCVMASGVSNNGFYADLFNFYKPDELFALSSFILPYVISRKIWEIYPNYSGYSELMVNEKIKLFTLKKIRNSHTIVKNGSGSWFDGVNWKSNDLWKTTEDQWDDKFIPKVDVLAMKRIIKYGIYADDIFMIKMYLTSKKVSKVNKLELLHRYKEIGYRKRFRERVFFVRKKMKEVDCE